MSANPQNFPVCPNGHRQPVEVTKFCIYCGVAIAVVQAVSQPPLQAHQHPPPHQQQVPPANGGYQHQQYQQQQPPPNYGQQMYQYPPQYQQPSCRTCGGNGHGLPDKFVMCKECRWLRPLVPGYAIDNSAFAWAADAKAMAALRAVKPLNAAAKAVSDKVGRRWIEAAFNGVLLGEKQMPHILVRLFAPPAFWGCHTCQTYISPATKLDVGAVDSDGDGEFETVLADPDGDGEFEEVDMEAVEAGEGDYTIEAESGLPTEQEISTNSVEFNLGSEGFEDVVVPPADGVAQDAGVYGLADSGDTYTAEAADPAIAQQAADAEAARAAQEQADAYVAEGDYAAAAEARATAEDAAYAAGDSSMLGASDAGDLENAAYKQETAAEYREQQAEHIAAGDYEAAKEDAQNAAYATGDADYQAGGSDHTSQSDQDAYNLGNAIYEEKNADYYADNAEWYAEAGMTDAAESSAAHAADSQAAAAGYADQADTTSVGYDVDASSAVASGGTYDAGGYDMSAVDTGMDAGVVDTTSYDSGYDDGTV